MTKKSRRKTEKIATKMQKHFRRSRRAKRAGVPDAVLSSCMRSAPELRPASGSRGLASQPQEIRNCQPLKMEPGNLRKCLQPLAGSGNFLDQRQGSPLKSSGKPNKKKDIQGLALHQSYLVALGKLKSLMTLEEKYNHQFFCS